MSKLWHTLRFRWKKAECLGANLDPTEIPGNEYSKADLVMGAPGVQTVDSAGLPVWEGWLCSESSLAKSWQTIRNDSAVK